MVFYRETPCLVVCGFCLNYRRGFYGNDNNCYHRVSYMFYWFYLCPTRVIKLYCRSRTRAHTHRAHHGLFGFYRARPTLTLARYFLLCFLSWVGGELLATKRSRLSTPNRNARARKTRKEETKTNVCF